MANVPELGEHKIRELVNQTKFYMEAVNGLNAALASPKLDSTASIFRETHSMLTHAGAMSRILWGQGKKKETFEAYRRDLGMQEKEWILQSRDLRNALEHYDERLDSWGERNIVVDLNVGPKDSIHFGEDVDLVFDRHFDTSTMTFSVRDDSVNLQQLTDEVVQIGILAETKLSDHRFVR